MRIRKERRKGKKRGQTFGKHLRSLSESGAYVFLLKHINILLTEATEVGNVHFYVPTEDFHVNWYLFLVMFLKKQTTSILKCVISVAIRNLPVAYFLPSPVSL